MSSVEMSESAEQLYESFKETMHLLYDEEKARKMFAYDLCTSSPNVFLDGDVNSGVVDPCIIEAVEQFSYREIESVVRIDRAEESSATISEKLVAISTLMRSGISIERAIPFVVNGSDAVVVEINAGNFDGELISALRQFGYDDDEISEKLDEIVSCRAPSLVCNSINNGLVSDADELESILEGGHSRTCSIRF